MEINTIVDVLILLSPVTDRFLGKGKARWTKSSIKIKVILYHAIYHGRVQG